MILKKSSKRRQRSSVVDGVLEKLGQRFGRMQRRAAVYLNRKTAGLSCGQLKIGLVLFCLAFGGSSAFTIWHSLGSPSGGPRVQPISVPRQVVTEKNKTAPPVALTGPEVSGIRRFRAYLDSLRRTSKGRVIYDSIARQRPGLLDSLAFIEQQYHKQLKTSEDGDKK